MPAVRGPSAAYTVRDICDSEYVALDYRATVAVVANMLGRSSIGVIFSDSGGLPVGVITLEILQGIDRDNGRDLTALADAALLAAGNLPLDRAFRILLAHPEMRWIAVEADKPGQPIQGLIARSQLIPGPLERFKGTAMDRIGLPGDPILPASGLFYRCCEDPAGHVFTAVQIETWTPELRALCPVDGKMMVPYVGAVQDSGGS